MHWKQIKAAGNVLGKFDKWMDEGPSTTKRKRTFEVASIAEKKRNCGEP